MGGDAELSCDHMMPLATKPVEIHAWIVAVERYAGHELDVPAPIGMWALQIADLLLRRRAKTQIVFSSSLRELPDYPASVRDLQRRGVETTGASRVELEA